MNWTVQHIETILWVTGLFTASVGLMALAPTLGLRIMFKEERPSPLLVFVFRHWAVVVASLGALLILAANQPELRTPVIIAAGIEKAILVLMVLSNLRSTDFAKWALPAAIVDTVCVAMYVMYLLGTQPVA